MLALELSASSGEVSPRRFARRRIAVTETHHAHLLKDDLAAASPNR